MDHTSVHVRAAVQGDPQSLTWIVVHFTPLLRLQARVRMPEVLRRIHEPEDVVQEVWAITLPRLRDLRPREGRLTPVLLRFLGTVLLRRVNNLMVRVVRSGGHSARPDSEAVRSAAALPATVTDALERVLRQEKVDALERAIEKLDPEDQELLVLRGIEQQANKDVAKRLGLRPGACAMRFHRLLDSLRKEVPRSLLDDLPDSM